MEFKSLTNIESSFRRIRLMLAVFTGCCALVTGYALWSSYRFAERQREKIYVLDGGRLAEQGTHAELVEAGGLYARMWADYRTSAQWRIGKEGGYAA